MVGLTPGWYEDRDDPTLARWFDGERLTDHTLVIADQVPGRIPPPPEISALARSGAREPIGWAAPADPEAWANEPPRPAPSADTPPPPGDDQLEWTPDDVPPFSPLDEVPLPATVRSLPEPFFDHDLSDEAWERQVGWRWVWITGGGIALLLVAIIGLKLGGDDGGGGGPTEVAATEAEALAEAVAVAMEASDVTFFANAGFESLLPLTCEAAETGEPDELVATLVALDYDDAVLLRLLHGLQVGAESLCPDAIDDQPNMLSEVHNAIIEQRVPDVTAPSPSPSTDTSSTTSTTKPSGGGRSTTTTRPSGTTSTSAPATTTTPPTTPTTVEETTTSTTAVI
jgi:hypothetical protein